MKKKLLYLAAGLTLLVSQGCKKSATEAVTETVTVNLSTSQTYRYALPASDNSASYVVESAGVNSATASVVSDASGSTFIYTPAANFSGKDQVIISSHPAQLHADGSQCHHNGCGHKPASHVCDGASKQTHSIVFNLVVAAQTN